MDARHYNGLHVVATGQFTPGQRQRLEAFTAANGLLGKDAPLEHKLMVAQFITVGAPQEV